MNKNYLGILSLMLASVTAVADTEPVEKIIATWPDNPRETAKMLIEKYGQPHLVMKDQLVWNSNGIWKRTIVFRDEIAHHFPKHHTDYLEQVIDYKVPLAKFSELAAFDGSVIAKRTKGELSARCNKEELNLLALNLAHEVAAGIKTVEAARVAYGENAAKFLNGEKPPYTQALQFERPQESTRDPDQPIAE